MYVSKTKLQTAKREVAVRNASVVTAPPGIVEKLLSNLRKPNSDTSILKKVGVFDMIKYLNMDPPSLDKLLDLGAVDSILDLLSKIDLMMADVWPKRY